MFAPGARYPLAGLLRAAAAGGTPCWTPPARSTASSRTGSTGWAPCCVFLALARGREENYFRYARTRFALDALEPRRRPRRPGPDGAQPGQEDRCRPHQAGRSRRPGRRAARDATLLQLRSPAPGQAAYLTNQVINALPKGQGRNARGEPPASHLSGGRPISVNIEISKP